MTRWQELAYRQIRQHLGEDGVGVDATLGSGENTLMLASRLGDKGQLHSFDERPGLTGAAAERLEAAGLGRRVSLYPSARTMMSQLLPPYIKGQVKAILFHLGGWVANDPAGVETTITALWQAGQLLARGGVICIIADGDDPAGLSEARAVEAWSASLSAHAWDVTIRRSHPPESHPHLFHIVRRDN